MDEQLIKDDGDGYLGTAEVRIPRAVLYELAPALNLLDCDRDNGWPVGTASALKHRYPERWQNEFNKLIDQAVGHFQKARLTVMERLITGCTNAMAITEAAMTGEKFNDKPVTKDMQVAAREWLKIARDFAKDSGDLTPADGGELEDDEETAEMAEFAEELGIAPVGGAEETN